MLRQGSGHFVSLDRLPTTKSVLVGTRIVMCRSLTVEIEQEHLYDIINCKP